jgi:Family of unknown function (DUF6220)
MRKLFIALSAILMAIVLAQFFFAASGGFSTDREEAYGPHHALGYVIFIWPLVMIAVAAIGRMPGRLIGLTALVPVLVSVQVVIAKVAHGMVDNGQTTTASDLVFGLHGVGGVATAVVAGMILRRARALGKPAGPAAA